MPTVEDAEEVCENCKAKERETVKVKLPTKTKNGLDVWVCPVCDLGKQPTNDEK